MSNKQLVAIVAIAFMAYLLFNQPSSASNGSQPTSQIDCGASPGAAPLTTRLAWALCESNKSVKADEQAAGR